MKIKSIIFVIMLVISSVLAACGSEDKKTTTEPEANKEVLQVYTTIFPLKDFTEKIGGEFVEVHSLIPVGADAHTFEPTAKTMVDVSKADLYIYNGAGIEGFADAAAEVLKNEKVKILKASEGIDLINFDHDHGHDHEEGHDHAHGNEEHDHEHEEESHSDNHEHEEDEHAHEEGHDNHGHGELDPHVWLDPIRSIQLAENIKLALIELMPEAKDYFEQNFVALKEQLEALDRKFAEALSTKKKDTIVVSHAGYGYWTERYGVKQVGITGISPTNEPSIRQLQKVIEFTKQQQIGYIIFEQNIPAAIAETVRNQVGAEALWLHNLEVLTKDDVTNNEDYFSLMKKNIETVANALQ